MNLIVHENPTIYLHFETITGILGFSFNLFTAYLIVYVSPKQMSRYKWYILWYQFWSSLYELLLHGCVVELYFPAPSFKGYGILYENPIYAFDGDALFKIGLVFVGNMIVATFQCFLYRHQVILPDDHWLKFPTWVLLLLILIHYLAIVPPAWFFIGAIDIENPPNARGLPRLLQEFPEFAFIANDPTAWIGDTTGLVAPPTLNFTGALGLEILVCVFAPEITTVTLFLILHSFYMLNGNAIVMSAKTRRLHKNLCISLFVQMIVPFGLVIIPLLFYAYIFYSNSIFPQEWVNASMTLVYAHATVSSALICGFTEPYREFIMKFVRRILGRLHISKVTVVLPATREQTTNTHSSHLV